jgi:hypothetical protein
MRWMVIVVWTSVVLVGCADYSYERVQRDSATVDRSPDHVRTVVLGIEPPSTAPPVGAPSLRARLVVGAESGAPWRIVAAEQRVQLPDGRDVAAAPAASVEVPPGEDRLVELRFPLPPPFDRASRLPKLAILWRLDGAHGPVEGRATFVRVSQFPTMPCGAYADPYCLSGYAGP